MQQMSGKTQMHRFVYNNYKKKYKIFIFVHIDTISDNNEPHYKTELFRRCRWG